MLLFVSWQFPEQLNSYSTNLGQPRLTNRGAAGFEQADIPPGRAGCHSWWTPKASFILKFCFPSIKLILVKKKNGVQCHLHSFWWAFSSMRIEIIMTSLVSRRSRNCPTVFPWSIQIQYHCGAILGLEELWSRPTNSSQWVTHKNWIHSPRGSCWSLEAIQKW